MTDSTPTPASVVEAFNAAWNAHDLEAVLALVSEDCLFDATSPAPDGEQFVGRSAIAEAWAPLFSDPNALFTVETAFAGEDHVVQQWRYDWDDGHVRGVDLFRVTGDLIVAKLSYVKG